MYIKAYSAELKRKMRLSYRSEEEGSTYAGCREHQSQGTAESKVIYPKYYKDSMNSLSYKVNLVPF
jgi:hypothetical protein